MIWHISGKFLSIDDFIHSKTDNYIYINLQHEDNPVKVELQVFKNIHQSLVTTNTDIFSYYEIYEQPLFIQPETELFYDEMITDPNQIDCIQISENVQSDFGFSLLNGRIFSDGDYEYNGHNNIPVILGYSYADFYSIGDSFQGNYLFDTYNFHIIGFLDKGCYINLAIKTILVDDCFIIPSFNITNAVDITDGLKIHYANKTSGHLKVFEDNYQEAYDYVKTAISDTEAGEYSVDLSSSDYGFRIDFGIHLSLLNKILFITLLLSIILLIYPSNLYIKQKNFKKKCFEFILFTCIIIIPLIVYYIILFYTSNKFGFKIQYIFYLPLSIIFDVIFGLVFYKRFKANKKY